MSHHPAPLTRLAALATLTLPALGQELLAVDDTNDRVMRLRASDGVVLDPAFIDLRAGGGRTPGVLIEAYDAGNGEVWVTDQTAGVVHRWSADGLTWLGEFGEGTENLRGLHVHDGRIWICNSGPIGAGFGTALLEYDLAYQLVNAYPYPGSLFDVTSLAGELLVSDTTNDDLARVDPRSGGIVGYLHDSDGVTGVDFPCQLAWTATGTLLTVGLSAPMGVYEYDTSGTQVAYIASNGTTTAPQGVHELTGGDLVIGAGNGLWRYDRALGTFTNLAPGIDVNYITPRGGDYCDCRSYCVANPSSTGRAARMTARGSSSVAANDLVLSAYHLPANTFGQFLTATQAGFSVNPGGSQGVLCLGGPVGRYVGPGQVQNTGASGTLELALDLTQHPTPAGPVAVVAGATWHFTAWYRDANPAPTSNFADGLRVNFGQ